MRKQPFRVIALGAGLAATTVSVALAAHYQPTVIRAGDLVISVNGSISPATLPKKRAVPIEARARGTVAMQSGAHPPAARLVKVKIDRSFSITTKGLPACTLAKLTASPTAAAKRACPNSILGTGSAEAEVAFPEQAPFTATGPLLFFFGGSKGNTTRLLVHLYANVPAPTAIVTTVDVNKVHDGPYGYEAVARVPVIAGGSGSVTKFNFKINREYDYGGKPQSYVAAKCPSGKYLTEIEASFSDGTSLRGTLTRACTPRA